MLKMTLFSIAIAALVAGGWTNSPAESDGGPIKQHFVPSDNQKFIDKLQGKWNVVEAQKATKGGRFVDDEARDRKEVFEFHCDEWSMTQGDERLDESEFSIDASKTPMWIDMETTKGIFRIEGNRLTICYGKNRPGGFDPVAGQEAEQYVLKRITPKSGDRGQNKIQPLSPPKALQDLGGIWTAIGILDGTAIIEKQDAQAQTLKISGDTAIWRVDGERFENSIKVDDSKTPNLIEFHDRHPSFRLGHLLLPIKGVFRIEGDTLTLRVSQADEQFTGFDNTSSEVPAIVFKKKKSP